LLRLVSFIFVLVVSALLLSGCGGGASKQDFAQDMVAARNDADAGLAQIVEATSWDDLLARMKVAAVELRDAATDVRTADAPDELEDERDVLANRLLALSDEIIATVETFEELPEQVAATRALSFEQWTTVQASLAALRREGVDVPPLERHTAQPQRR
jgi:hypothetical protein